MALLALAAAAASASSRAPEAPANDARDAGGDGTSDGRDAEALFDEGETALRAGRSEAALASYLAAWDASVGDASALGLRTTHLLDRLHELSASLAEASVALEARRALAVEDVLGGGAWLSATDVAAIDRVQGRPERTLEAWERAAEELPPDDAGRSVLFHVVLEDLIERRRYADVLDGLGDVEAHLERTIEAYARTADVLSPGGLDADRTDPLRRRVVEEAADSYEALLGVGHRREADDLARRVLAFDDSLEARTILQERAVRAGDTAALRRLPPP